MLEKSATYALVRAHVVLAATRVSSRAIYRVAEHIETLVTQHTYAPLERDTHLEHSPQTRVQDARFKHSHLAMSTKEQKRERATEAAT